MNVNEVRWIYWALVILIIGFAVLVFYRLWRVDFTGIIQEPGTDKASLSRFQFLLFTFVIAGLYLVFCIDTGDFIEIPGSVLALMGISGGSYVVSKGISEETTRRKIDAAAKHGAGGL
ncbi:MAG TPA: hypothetical protein VE046_01260 [Steroidobacteraceae bacterium]|nr:hypothetical protein [Steroidobacteraceae bacterium]